ncbi:MAG: hypothetical protein Kow00105_09740 [Phycisphaeraceae bacterium]
MEQYLEYALYAGSVVGAIALALMLPRSTGGVKFIGPLLGVASLGGVWLFLSNSGLWADRDTGLSGAAFVYYYLFSAIAIVAAVRVITHTRPVYAALWFVMVILASAGLFLVLSAEFMAFAMVIIYGGAILVTYMFVLMLASQSTSDREVQQSYDKTSKDPALASAAGFLLLAVLLSVSFDYERLEAARLPIDPAMTDAALIDSTLGNRPLKQERVFINDEAGNPVEVPGPTPPPNLNPNRLTNSERVGLDLFMSHPLGLELAGVILLVSLIGAVVIARTKVPDETQVVSG